MPQDPIGLERFLGLAEALAKQFARKPDDVDDLFQEGCIALHLALQKTPCPDDPWAFARTTLRKAMYSFYHRAPKVLPLVSELPLNVAASPVQDDLIEDFLDALEVALGKRARWIAENLIAPGDSVGRYVLLEVAEKEEDARRGIARRNYGSQQAIRVSRRHVREASGLSVSRWRTIFGQIQVFALAWLVAQGVAVSLLPPT